MNLGIFGEVECFETGDIFERKEVSINGRTSLVDIYVSEEVLELKYIAELNKILGQYFLDKIDETARENFSLENEIVSYFVEFHLDELSEEMQEKGIEDENSFLGQLELTGIGVHLTKLGKIKINLDYNIDLDLSDELLVATFDIDAHLVSISHES